MLWHLFPLEKIQILIVFLIPLTLKKEREKTDLLRRNCLRDEKMGSTHNHLFVNKTPCTTSESQLVDEVVSGNF